MENVQQGWNKKKVILIENNPLDRAVIDVIFSFDKDHFELRYSAGFLDDAEVRAIGIRDLFTLLDNANYGALKPDIVLLDLALTSAGLDAFKSVDFNERFRRIPFYVLSRKLLGLKPHIRALRIATLYFGGILNNNLLNRYREEYSAWAKSTLETGHKGSKDKIGQQIRFAAETAWKATADGQDREMLLECARSFFDEIFEQQADNVILLTRAPELFEIFLMIAGYPEVCFGILSHFAHDQKKEVLSIMLSYRYPGTSTVKQKIFAPLVCDKGHLFGVGQKSYTAKLKDSYIQWKKYSSEKYYLAPFSDIRLLKHPGRSVLPFSEALHELETGFKNDFDNPIAVIFDEPGIFISRWPVYYGAEGSFAMTINWNQPLTLETISNNTDLSDNLQRLENCFCTISDPIGGSPREFYAILKALSARISDNMDPNRLVLVVRGQGADFQETFRAILKEERDQLPVYEVEGSLRWPNPDFQLIDGLLMNTLLAYDGDARKYNVLPPGEFSKAPGEKNCVDFLTFGDYLGRLFSGDVYKKIKGSADFQAFRNNITGGEQGKAHLKNQRIDLFWKELWQRLPSVIEEGINKIEVEGRPALAKALRLLSDSQIITWQ